MSPTTSMAVLRASVVTGVTSSSGQLIGEPPSVELVAFQQFPHVSALLSGRAGRAAATAIRQRDSVHDRAFQLAHVPRPTPGDQDFHGCGDSSRTGLEPPEGICSRPGHVDEFVLSTGARARRRFPDAGTCPTGGAKVAVPSRVRRCHDRIGYRVVRGARWATRSASPSTPMLVAPTGTWLDIPWYKRTTDGSFRHRQSGRTLDTSTAAPRICGVVFDQKAGIRSSPPEGADPVASLCASSIHPSGHASQPEPHTRADGFKLWA